MSEIQYSIGDIVRLDDTGYPGLYEITTAIDIVNHPDFFDYDFFVTNNDCESEMAVKRNQLIFVCKAKCRADI